MESSMRIGKRLAVLVILGMACQSAAPVKTSTVVADMDTKVRACDDFYQFANGTFLASNPVPPAFSRWGRFDMLAERNNEVLRQILDEASASRTNSNDPDVRKLGTYY